MTIKKSCPICGRRRNLFAVDRADENIKVCSICITEELLTGWSK